MVMMAKFPTILSVLVFSAMSVVATSIFPASRKLSGEDLMRVRASTDERQSTVVEWQGQVLYVTSFY
jgi:hypothetical protein